MRERARPSFFAAMTGVMGHYVRLSPDRRELLRQLGAVPRGTAGFALARAVSRVASSASPPPIDIPFTPAGSAAELMAEFRDYLPGALRALLPSSVPTVPVSAAAAAAAADSSGRLGVVRLDGTEFSQRDVETEAGGRRVFAMLFEYERPLGSTSTAAPQPCYRSAIWDGGDRWMPVPGFVVRHSAGGTSAGTGLGFAAGALARHHGHQLKLGRPVYAFTIDADAPRRLAHAVDRSAAAEEALSPDPPTAYAEPVAATTAHDGFFETVPVKEVFKPAPGAGLQLPYWMSRIPPHGWTAIAAVICFLLLYCFISCTYWLAWVGGTGSKNLVLDTLLVRNVTSLGHVGVTVAEISDDSIETWSVKNLQVNETATLLGSVSAQNGLSVSGGELTATLATVSGRLSVTGATEAAGVTVDSLTAGTALTVSPGASAQVENLSVTGTATAATVAATTLTATTATIDDFSAKIDPADIDFTGGLTVPELSVSGAATFTAGLTATGGATLGGTVEFASGSTTTMGGAFSLPSGSSFTAASGSTVSVDAMDVASADITALNVGSMGGITTSAIMATTSGTGGAVAALAGTTGRIEFGTDSITLTGATINLTGDGGDAAVAVTGSLTGSGTVTAAAVTAADVTASSTLTAPGLAVAATPAPGVTPFLVTAEAEFTQTVTMPGLTFTDLSVEELTVTKGLTVEPAATATFQNTAAVQMEDLTVAGTSTLNSAVVTDLTATTATIGTGTVDTKLTVTAPTASVSYTNGLVTKALEVGTTGATFTGGVTADRIDARALYTDEFHTN